LLFCFVVLVVVVHVFSVSVLFFFDPCFSENTATLRNSAQFGTPLASDLYSRLTLLASSASAVLSAVLKSSQPFCKFPARSVSFLTPEYPTAKSEASALVEEAVRRSPSSDVCGMIQWRTLANARRAAQAAAARTANASAAAAKTRRIPPRRNCSSKSQHTEPPPPEGSEQHHHALKLSAASIRSAAGQYSQEFGQMYMDLEKVRPYGRSDALFFDEMH
jgi:hypothetical protein